MAEAEMERRMTSDPGNRILVVDDNGANRYAVARTLRGEGFEVFEAERGADALALLRAERPDLMVLDVMLPDILGFEVARRVRADPDTAAVSILQLSATFTDAESHEAGLGAGADAYLTHPFEARVLIATVRALLRMRAAERVARELLQRERDARLESERAREAAEQTERALRASDARGRRLLGELEEAMRRRDEFLAIATHDIKSPLMALSLNLQGLVHLHTHGADVPLPKLVSKLQAANDQAQRLVELLENLLDVSRLTSGKLDVQPEDLDLAALTREVAGHMQPQFVAAHCELQLNAAAPVRGRWDRIRLEQLMTNLFSNAIKYGSGKLVEIAACREGEIARLVVRDHGIGIAAQDRERVFVQFERLRPGADAKSFGLGLWIVRRIVDALGGRIRLESDLGQGSTFTVDLPLDSGRA